MCSGDRCADTPGYGGRGSGPGETSGRCGCHGRGGQIEGFAIPCLLLLLVEKSAHGYDLIDRLGGEFGLGDIDPGGVYRNLKRMEEDGFLQSTWETDGPGPARKVYSVTREGEELLAVWATSIARNKRALEAFMDRYAKTNKRGETEDVRG
jgi:poly-beta-hydroxybutyrate-responsive repressor